MKKLFDYVHELDATTITKAQKYLDSDKVKSVKYAQDELDPNEFEAFIYENGVVLLPGIEVDEQFHVLDLHCQCENGEVLAFIKRRYWWLLRL